ncbi:MAG TPA: molybdopterin-dependent oxidoreductase [Syntrophomonadaceae bacterium]|nr:molybdopterin-dependent oxidoreductase [Syntrophomonadaceae bacterium]
MSNNNKEKTVIKGLGFCGFAMGSNTCEVDVKDGKIIRTRPFRYDKNYPAERFRPWTLKAKGKEFDPGMKSFPPPFSIVYKKRAFSPNRIPYPLKRVDWDPEGERNPQNRGISKYVRISWDEATDLIAKEINRVCEEYSSLSILAQADGHGETKSVHGGHGCQAPLLDLLGSATMQARNADSWEGWYWGGKHIWGQDPVGQGEQTNLWKDVSENTDTILFWGCDQETTPWGWSGQQASRLTYWFKDLGIDMIYICPDLNYAAAVHADKWIPVYPNTDSALQLAIAYTWILEDTYDKEYIKTHSHGFEEFKAYVMGEEDGIPKTPKWAAPICGVPSRTIKALARKWAKEDVTIAHGNGGSFIRSTYASEPARLEICLLGMQALGKPGRNQMKMIEWNLYNLHSQNPGPRTEIIPSTKGCYNGTLGFTPNTRQFIPKTLIPDAIVAEEPITWYGHTRAGYPAEDQFIEYKYPIDDGGTPIRMIWSDTPCWTTCWNGGNRFIEAIRHKSIEFFLVQHIWMENDCHFADIILPVNTKFETEDIAIDTMSGQYNLLYHEGQCIEPYGESKSDWEAVAEVAKKLGLYEEYTQGKTVEDCIKIGFEESGVAHYVDSYEEFRDKEYIVIPVAEDWENDPPGFFPFYEDPEQFPLSTPTGKLEFSSTNIKEQFPDDDERGPVPKFIPYGKTHQESMLHSRSEEFPYLIVSNHPRWRVHANLDDISWLREIPTCKVEGKDGYLYEPVWINPIDAIKENIKQGDIVEVYNDRGIVLGGAYVTERIKPGVVYQDHGARLDSIDAGKIDRGGANNLICPGNTTSQNCAGEVTSGFLVNIAKADMKKLRTEYPDAFAKQYDKDSGVAFEACLEKEV